MRLFVTMFMFVGTLLATGFTNKMFLRSFGVTCQLSVSPRAIVSSRSSFSKIIAVEMPCVAFTCLTSAPMGQI